MPAAQTAKIGAGLEPAKLEPAELESAAALLEGHLVALPTETVWGVAARYDSEAAVELLYARKGREPGKPVQLLCASPEAALAFVAEADVRAAARLAAFWPGPLTLVVAARDLPGWMAPGGRVGLRVPVPETTRRVLERLPGRAAAASSLNPAGGEPARDEAGARAFLGSLVDRVHPGPPAAGLSSSVFDLAARRLLREGAVGLPALLEALEGA